MVKETCVNVVTVLYIVRNSYTMCTVKLIPSPSMMVTFRAVSGTCVATGFMRLTENISSGSSSVLSANRRMLAQKVLPTFVPSGMLNKF